VNSLNDKNIDDLKTPVVFFKNQVKDFVEKRNWSKYHTIKNLIQALGIEVAELSEIFLFKDLEKSQIMRNPKLMEEISDEIADIFIYLISLVNVLDLDLTTAFLKKMSKNKKKYPLKEFKNGNYYKK